MVLEDWDEGTPTRGPPLRCGSSVSSLVGASGLGLPTSSPTGLYWDPHPDRRVLRNAGVPVVVESRVGTRTGVSYPGLQGADTDIDPSGKDKVTEKSVRVYRPTWYPSPADLRPSYSSAVCAGRGRGLGPTWGVSDGRWMEKTKCHYGKTKSRKSNR